MRSKKIYNISIIECIYFLSYIDFFYLLIVRLIINIHILIIFNEIWNLFFSHTIHTVRIKRDYEVQKIEPHNVDRTS